MELLAFLTCALPKSPLLLTVPLGLNFPTFPPSKLSPLRDREFSVLWPAFPFSRTSAPTLWKRIQGQQPASLGVTLLLYE